MQPGVQGSAFQPQGGQRENMGYPSLASWADLPDAHTQHVNYPLIDLDTNGSPPPGAVQSQVRSMSLSSPLSPNMCCQHLH